MTILRSFSGNIAITPHPQNYYYTAEMFEIHAERLRKAEAKYVGKRFSFWEKEGIINAVVGSEPGLAFWLVVVYDDLYDGKPVLQRIGHELFYILEDRNDND